MTMTRPTTIFFTLAASVWLAACGQPVSDAQADAARETSSVDSSSNNTSANANRGDLVDLDYAAELAAGAAAAAKQNGSGDIPTATKPVNEPDQSGPPGVTAVPAKQ